MSTSPAARPAAKVCVLLPAYNEGAHVGPVVESVLQQGLGVLVVDDGSTDDTAAVAERAGARVLRLPRNQGKGAALREGFMMAIREGCAAVITMDSDGQHCPGDLAQFTAAYRNTGIPVLIGNRMGDTAGMPWLRRGTNRFMSWLLCRHMNQYVPDTQNGFRLYQSDVLPLVFPESYGFAAESEILLNLDRMGVRMDSVPVRTIYGQEESSIRPLRDTVRFFRMLRRFLRRPGTSARLGSGSRAPVSRKREDPPSLPSPADTRPGLPPASPSTG